MKNLVLLLKSLGLWSGQPAKKPPARGGGGPKPIRPARRRPVTSLTLNEKLRPGVKTPAIVLYIVVPGKDFLSEYLYTP